MPESDFVFAEENVGVGAPAVIETAPSVSRVELFG